MTQDYNVRDYNTKLAQDYEAIRGKVERGMLPLVARIPAIDKAVSDYVLAQDEHFGELRNPPIQYRDSVALHNMADLVFFEELKWSHPDKMTIVDYPILTGWQEIDRDKKQQQTRDGEITFRDRQHNGRRKSSYFGKDGEVRVTNQKMPDRYDEAFERAEISADVMALVEGAKLTDRQRQAIELVYFEDMTQEQAADVMGVRKNTVNEHITISLRKMREIAEKTPNF